MTSAPINRDKVAAALSWLQDEIAHRESMSERAKAFQRVIGHQAAANHLRTLLADHAAQAEKLAPFVDIAELLESETSGFWDEDRIGVVIKPEGADGIEMAELTFGDFRALSKALPETGEQSQ